MKGSKTSELGFFAEHYCAEYLKSKNYKILGHNYRKPWGEIDVIVEKEGVVIFVEVKASKKDIAGFHSFKVQNIFQLSFFEIFKIILLV